uniref:Uncharacterized protein n=1 Tax=Neolamprologus brichardi TaxID=32507 RepID=A0A3Q4H6N5_NEOBR
MGPAIHVGVTLTCTPYSCGSCTLMGTAMVSIPQGTVLSLFFFILYTTELSQCTKTYVLKKELSSSEGFQKAWTKSNECSKQIPGGRKEHSAALSVYVNGDKSFIQTLNKAIETMGGNKIFIFKSYIFATLD